MTRLSRPHAFGRDVIERAAILAAGADATAIVDWIMAHAGAAGGPLPRPASRALHGARISDPLGADGGIPRLYPAGRCVELNGPSRGRTMPEPQKPSADIGPTITAMLSNGPLEGTSIEAEVVEGRPPKRPRR